MSLSLWLKKGPAFGCSQTQIAPEHIIQEQPSLSEVRPEMASGRGKQAVTISNTEIPLTCPLSWPYRVYTYGCNIDHNYIINSLPESPGCVSATQILKPASPALRVVVVFQSLSHV